MQSGARNPRDPHAPQDVPALAKLAPEAAAALVLRPSEPPGWSVVLVRAFSVFLVGSAIGFAVSAMFGPMDLATSADHPERPGLMEMWVKFGLPIVGLLSIAHAARARSDRPATTLLATTAMVMVSIGLVWSFYPRSRAQAVAVGAARFAQTDVLETAVSISAVQLAPQLARFRDSGMLDEFLRLLATRSDVLRGKARLPPDAVEALRQAASEGHPNDCATCLTLIRARLLLEDAAPGTLGSSFALCPDAACREQLAQLLLAGGSERFCLETFERSSILGPDLGALRRIAAGADAGVSAATQERIGQWLGAHPDGACPQPAPTPPPASDDAAESERST